MATAQTSVALILTPDGAAAWTRALGVLECSRSACDRPDADISYVDLAAALATVKSELGIVAKSLLPRGDKP